MASPKSSDQTHYSPKQAAEILAVSVKTIRRLIVGGAT